MAAATAAAAPLPLLLLLLLLAAAIVASAVYLLRSGGAAREQGRIRSWEEHGARDERPLAREQSLMGRLMQMVDEEVPFADERFMITGRQTSVAEQHAHLAFRTRRRPAVHVPRLAARQALPKNLIRPARRRAVAVPPIKHVVRAREALQSLIHI